jgi:2-(1,2-epoxy-1,2-dihydrophenyl)acetyl-CoA isomerase
MTEYHTVRYERRDGIATITLARPDKRNAMNRGMFAEVADAATEAGNDPEVFGVLVAGEGASFCAGIDLALLAEFGTLAALPGSEFRSFVREAQRPYIALSGLEKPTLAAVQGHALGAGFQLALACDLRVVARGASLALLETRYGIIPDLGGMHALARIVGPARAKELVWTARTVGAEEAERIGLANRVADPGRLRDEAEALLREVLAHSPVAVAQSKILIDRSSETSLEDELDREAQAQTVCVQSEDHREAVAAFFEKRAPGFKGR